MFRTPPRLQHTERVGGLEIVLDRGDDLKEVHCGAHLLGGVLQTAQLGIEEAALSR